MNYSYIKSALSYNPDSGVFTWQIDRGSKKIAGSVAGYLNDKGYVKIGINGKDMPAHRLAFLFMTGSMPPKNIQVDHINCVRHDNRWFNLRLATNSENQRNEGLRRNNTSGFKGVHWDKKRGLWRACSSVDGKQKTVGWFSSKEDAAKAVMLFREKHHGQFCNHG